MVYIGIDPGLSGGIAIIEHDGTVNAVKMPATERDILNVLGAGLAMVDARAVIERVSSWPKMGVVSAFTFGRGYGALLMALTAAEVPFDLVGPRQWQEAMSCLSGGDKNVTKRRAQQVFPSVKVTHAIADALLLAEFCRRVSTGRYPRGGKKTDGEKESGEETQGEGRRQGHSPIRVAKGETLEHAIERARAAGRAAVASTPRVRASS